MSVTIANNSLGSKIKMVPDWVPNTDLAAELLRVSLVFLKAVASGL